MLQQLKRVDEFTERDFGPVDVIRWFWRHKIALFLCTFLAGATTAGYSLTLPRSYQAVAMLRLVTPPETQSPLNSALGGLGGLAGQFLGANMPTDDTAVTLAYLRSPSFAREFIEANNLMPELYPTQWDAAQNRWIEAPPLLDRGASRFLTRVTTEQDAEGLVRLAVVWSSPERAREIAEMLIARINQLRRDQALEKAKGNFDYLTQRLAREPVQEMRATIANMASRELTLLMLAQGPSNYALEEIGSVFSPDVPFGPRRRVMTMVGAVVGFCLCAIFLLLRQAVKKP